MSREIKFRAWFRPTQKYKTWIANRYGNEPSGLELHYFTTEDFLDDTWVDTDDYEEPIVFEQYTGLKDKNGTEIYEGDIVLDYYDGEDAFIVEWDKDTASFILTGTDHIASVSFDNFDADIDLEVVGNIHENPELLEN